jgi:hypothetical protein
MCVADSSSCRHLSQVGSSVNPSLKRMEAVLAPLVVGSQNYVLIALSAMCRCSLGHFWLSGKRQCVKLSTWNLVRWEMWTCLQTLFETFWCEMNLSCVCKQMNLSLFGRVSTELLVWFSLVKYQVRVILFIILHWKLGQNQSVSVDSWITVILHMLGMF